MKIVKLGSVLKIQNGFAFKSTEYKNNGIPLIRISNIVDNSINISQDCIYVDENYLTSKKEFAVEKGDVVIALSGATTGKYGIYNFDFPSLLNQRIGLIRTQGSKLIDSKYFFFYLYILRDKILSKAAGAAQPNISTKEISNFQIPLPPLATQKHIADILDAADALRRKTQQIVDSYDELAQSLFLEMFGDPVRNPMDWDSVELQSLCKKITDGEHQNPTLVKEGYNLILAKDVLEDKVDFSEPRFVSEDDFVKFSKKCNPNFGDILIVSRGATIGRSTLVNTYTPFCLMGSVILLKLNYKINNHYLKYLLKNNVFFRNLVGVSSASAQQAIYLSHIKKLRIFLPPLDLQNQFAEKIALIEQQKELAKQSLAESENLFNALLQKAFKGELVPEPQPAEQAV